jgi:manganese/zinc/iron transport system substrate-binding protein
MTWRTTSIVALAGMLIMLITGCGDGPRHDDGLVHVVCSTGIVADMVTRVGGERVHVTALMGPGLDPHQYKASAGDVELLNGADLIAFNGLHLEAKLGEVFKHLARRRPVMALADSLPAGRLLSPPGYEQAHDPHVWFDTALWAGTAAPVAAMLAELDPDHAAAYRARAAAYRDELVALDGEVRARLAAIPRERRVLITAHDAFNYFGRAYDLEVRGLQGISTLTEAGTGDMQSLAAFIADRRLPAIFVENSVPPRAIEAVRKAVQARGWDVALGGELYSDSLGDQGGPAGDYVGMVRHNLDTIATALGGEVPHE